MVKVARSSTAAKTTSRAAGRKVESAAPSTPAKGKASPRRAASKSTAAATIASDAVGPATKPATRRAKAAPSGVAAKRTVRTPAAAKPSVATRSKAGAATPASPIDLGYLSDFVGFHLRLAQDASYRAFARVKDKDLVKPGRFPALAIIHLNPGISQSALGRAIARDKSTVSPLIKDLQNNGLISRKPSPNDRRSVTLVLTKKGERVLDRLHARALEHESDLDKLIGPSKSRLVSLLDKITGGFGA